MADPDEQITCNVHGTATTTYVCEHLGTVPVQRWHGAFPAPENPWPDAWCDRCNEIFRRDGEWNDLNSKELRLQVLCHHCYEDARGKSIHRLDGERLAAWRQSIGAFHDELHEKQEKLWRQFEIGRHKRWDWDQERGEIVFSNDGVAAVIASISFVGSVSQKSNTWLWAWANFSLSRAVLDRVTLVRDFGERQDFPHLVVPKWKADETDGWEMTSVAAHVMNAVGAYRTPSDNGFTFMVFNDVRFAQ